MAVAASRRGFLAATAGAFAQPQTRSRPNFLFLFADDQRFDTIRALGNREVITPNLDRLAREGTAFTHAHIMGGTIGAVCAPSRAMLLTGQTLFHVHRSIVAVQEYREDRRRDFTLFPELLRKAGYATFGTGKWHNGPALYARCFDQGGSVFFGGMSDHDRVPVAAFDPTGRYPAAGRTAGDGFSSELFSDAAIRFLRERRDDRPFLAYVAYTAPHDPRMAPPRYAAMYTPSKISAPPNFLPGHPFDNGEMKVRDEQLAPWPRTRDAVQQHLAAYYAMITHLDAQIGRVLDALDATGQHANTVVVFAGDNGLALGQHGLFGKQNLYEHSVRVPLLLRGPGIPSGVRRDALCYLSDLHPTLCQLAGVTAPPELVDGRSLVPALTRGTAVRDSVFYAYRHLQRGVRTRDWKLLEYNVAGRRTTQLFHLAGDPWETNNVAPDNPDRVRAMRDLLRGWMKDVDDPVDLDAAGWSLAPKG